MEDEIVGARQDGPKHNGQEKDDPIELAFHIFARCLEKYRLVINADLFSLLAERPLHPR